MTAPVPYYFDRKSLDAIHDANTKARSVFAPLLVRLEETARKLWIR